VGIHAAELRSCRRTVPGGARAFALETVGQEHVLFGVKELVDGLDVDQRAVSVVPQVTVDLLRQFVVFRRVGQSQLSKLM
jgi:hypothetical protein